MAVLRAQSVSVLAIFLVWGAPTDLFAQSSPGLAASQAEALAIPGATVTEYPDFTMVVEQDGLTIHYFTKPGHFAYPGAIRRAMVQDPEGGWHMVYEARYFVPKSQSGEPMQRWLEQFHELDRQMIEAIEAEQPRR